MGEEKKTGLHPEQGKVNRLMTVLKRNDRLKRGDKDDTDPGKTDGADVSAGGRWLSAV
jgi:hypothetical protein